MLNPDPETPFPSLREQIDVWKQLRVVNLPEPVDPAITELLDLLRKLFGNGDVLLQGFHIPPHPVFDWCASRRQLDRVEFPNRFLLMPSVHEALVWNLDEATVLATKFMGSDPLQLDGAIARRLVSGGAYRTENVDAVRAKRIGLAFCTALFGERYLEVDVFESEAAWSGWFRDVAWDYTAIVLDRGTRIFWLLCVTDTD